MRPKLQVRETATADQCQGRHSGGSTAPRTRSKEASQLDSRFETLAISLAIHSRVDRRQKTGPSWLIAKLQLCFRGRSGKLASGGRTGSLHSLGVAIARIIFVLIVMAVIVFSELMNINFVKHGTK